MTDSCRRHWQVAKIKYQREGWHDFYVSLENPLHADSPYVIKSFASIHWAIGFEKGKREHQTSRGLL